MLRVEWKGIFRKTIGRIQERKELHLNFNTYTLDAAHTIIQDYIEGKCKKGWRLLSNEVNIHQISDTRVEESEEAEGL